MKTRTKILLIDDDPGIIEIVSFILSEEGYEVRTSLTGNVLQKVLDIKPDLILLDNWLNEKLTGCELCRNLKTTVETRHIPIMLFSASYGLKQRSDDCLADGYMAKPFSLDELQDTMELILSKHLLREQMSPA